MGIIDFMPMGSWWLRSDSDPRWDRNGRGNVGLFVQAEGVPEAKAWLEHCAEEFGDEPSDLQWGYMKD